METISAKITRFDPEKDEAPWVQEYHVPLSPGMSAMDILDYIYQNLDSSIAYYDHAACALGACAKCICRINGQPGLLCQTVVSGDIILEPSSLGVVVRDLVVNVPVK